MNATETVNKTFSTNGRDRVNRLVQLLTKFLSLEESIGFSKESREKLLNLSNNIGQARKLMRIGRQVEFIVGARKASNIKDDFIRATTVGKNLSLAIWLAFDSISWFQSIGLITSTKEQKKSVVDRGNKFWLFGLFLSILCNLYKYSIAERKLVLENKHLRQITSKKMEADPETKNQLVTYIKNLKEESKASLLLMVHDIFDAICFPALGLELTPSFFTPKMAFGLGTITTATGSLPMLAAL
ncbi:Peroxisomal membrane protein PMP27 [Lobulomyces angularis]|nr:Peroxisomal membrane protein PMP27 [Lobulomyces angularis]